jgi:hypothetical protein
MSIAESQKLGFGLHFALEVDGQAVLVDEIVRLVRESRANARRMQVRQPTLPVAGAKRATLADAKAMRANYRKGAK